jgi:hypothetical protein
MAVPSQSLSSMESKVTMIWGDDGWCYIPQLSIRYKFKEPEYVKEPWSGVIPMPEYFEEVTSEQLAAFEQKFSNLGTHKKTKSRLKPR